MQTNMNAGEQFETIVSEYYEPLFRFALSLTRVEADAWDLTQQTFLVWATKGHQLRDISKVKTWLFTTLHRSFVQGRRKQIRFPHQDLETVVEQLPALSPELADQLDSLQVLSALRGVDEIYQAAVALFYLEDCSYKDIAVILEVPIGTVKSRIARGIAQLRGNLLSDARIAAALPGDEAAFVPVPNERAASAGELPRLLRHSASGAGVAESMEEWDLSSTLLRERICPA